MLKILLVSLFAAAAHAQTVWEVKTPVDNFTIEVVNSRKGRIDGKDVPLAPLSKFTTVMRRKFTDGCPKLPGKSPITIVQKKGEEQKQWKLYVTQGIWSDGENCLAVGGEGLNEFPLSRQWFTAPDRITIDLGDKFTVSAGADTLTFVSDRGFWSNTDTDFFIDWSKVENLVNTLNGFTIGVRTTKKPPADAPSFTLRAGRKTYKFVRVDEDWATDIESRRWLAISPDFRWLQDVSKDSWRSPNAEDLALLKKTGTPAEERIAIMKKLAGAYNPNIKHAVQELVLSRDESPEIKRHATQIIRHHPTDDSMLVLATALTKTDDPELLHVMSDALRVKNPRGPRISTIDRPAQIEKKVQEWQKWANELQTKLKK